MDCFILSYENRKREINLTAIEQQSDNRAGNVR
jgi:hypothetical protein